MKRTRVLRTMALLVCLVMALPIFARSSGLDPIEVTFYFWGDKPNQMDDVIAEFESRTADSLNMKMYMDWTPIADYPNRMKLKLSAGEEVDACFDAQWMNLNTFIADGIYTDLSPYFNNDEYPALKAAFDIGLMSNNTLGTGKNYGIPFTQSYGVAPLVYLRGDLREKYGIARIDSPELYREYLQAIVDNEPNMVPYACSPNVYWPDSVFTNELYRWDIDRLNAGVWKVDSIITGVTAEMYIKDYQIQSVVLSGEPESAYADFPEPYNKRDLTRVEMANEFYNKGFLDPDVMTVTDPSGQFVAGKAASLYWDTANFVSLKNGLAASVPDGKIEVYQPNPIYREDLKGMQVGNYAAWNFMCIPVTTSKEKADRVMMFYDWMYSSAENHDLFEYGIEGRHFVAVGDDMFKTPDGVDMATNYAFPGYQFTWNANFVRLSADMPEDIRNYNKKGNDPETYYNPIFSGFTFQVGPVEMEASNPDFATFKAERDNINFGVVNDVAAAYEALDAKYAANQAMQEDIAAIKAEFIRQFQEHLDARKIFDEENGTVYPK